MYKIFSQNKVIIIDSVDSVHDGTAHQLRDSADLFQTYIQFIADAASSKLVISYTKPDEAWNNFQQHFRLIDAAGGVVRNTNLKTLMIFRHNRWDLPKGKIEKDEKIEAAALREVAEECGIKNIAISKSLPTTFHTYILNEQHILKKTYWFEMNYSGSDEKLVPQTEEGITEVKWMTQNEIKNVADNTYPLIRSVLESK